MSSSSLSSRRGFRIPLGYSSRIRVLVAVCLAGLVLQQRPEMLSGVAA